MSRLKSMPFAPKLEQLDARDLPSVVIVSEAEPNNSPRSAQVLPMETDVRVTGSIGTLRDVDFYRIPLVAGQRVAINCHDTSGRPDRHNQLDPMIALYDPTGRMVGSDDDSGTGSGWASALSYTATASGNWTVGVTDYGDFAFDGVGGDGDGFGTDTGNYLLRITTGARADLAATALAWNPTDGGLTLSYSVQGTVPAGTPLNAQVFWATGPTAADRLGDPIATGALTNLSSGSGSRTVNVPGADLRNAPARATHLVVRLDPGNRVAETNEADNVVAVALAVTGDQLRRLNPGLSATQAASFVAPLSAAMAEFGIHSAGQRAAFLAQLGHESTDLARWEENLNYTTLGALRNAYGVFRTMPDARAAAYLRNPERLANFVYANRNGNGDEASGDGWRFRGRGPFMLTGRANYRTASQALGYAGDPALDLVSHPELVADWQNHPVIGFRTAARFFANTVPALTAPTGATGVSIRRDVLAHHTLTGAQLGETLRQIASRLSATSRQSIIDINRVVTFGVNGGENGLADRLNRFHNGLVLFLGANAVARL